MKKIGTAVLTDWEGPCPHVTCTVEVDGDNFAVTFSGPSTETCYRVDDELKAAGKKTTQEQFVALCNAQPHTYIRFEGKGPGVSLRKLGKAACHTGIFGDFGMDENFEAAVAKLEV